ncbi:MAG: FeoB small GTPase domain-containing protein [Bacillota bacterium]
MGLTYQSGGSHTWREAAIPNGLCPVVALAGNPNTGKSTLFNALTGLNQHTGNWPGKTVLRAEGVFSHKGSKFTVVDLPGTYSLMANSAEEQVARDFLCFGDPKAVVIVADATCLERNLNLVLQITEITPRVLVCLNLMDEAVRKGIKIDVDLLSQELGVPVIPAVAREGKGLKDLMNSIYDVACGLLVPNPIKVVYHPQVEGALVNLESRLRPLLPTHINARWLALRLLDGDKSIVASLEQHFHQVKAIPSVGGELTAWAR